ncbi:thiamine-phosphate kinase [Candidatus Cyanaurora vandensis]|uniref:thiamine-phosphate kinase n=1 Tax=Candidatus Cyanaurora vandensis TaxID=2714958 RepID=UPI00258074A9|nr:thiamine-phosphate kinase [Candidatus Cyanaurora vandensis]
MTTLKDLGEQGLLRRLAPFWAAPHPGVSVGVGDDGAVLALTGELVVTVDLLVEGVHFSPTTTPPHAVGWRACAANLSDLAAMGAAPLGLVVGLGLPTETTVAWVEDVYRGIVACNPVPIVGGDTCRAPHRTLSITALGQVGKGRAFLRSGCRVGDVLMVTGPFGGSRAGLAVLQDPDRYQNLPSWATEAVIRAHQYPVPRLDAVAPLQQLPQPVGAMDTSDGLADALVQMAQLSGVGLVVDLTQVPITSATRLVAQEQALAWALYGGEDFELLVSLPPASPVDYPLQLIGRVVAQHPGEVRDTQDHPITRMAAFTHF